MELTCSRATCSRRGSRSRRGGAGRSLTGVSDLQAIGERRHATREDRSRAGRACLDTARLVAATIRSCPVDDVKGGRVVLVKHHFKLDRGGGVSEMRCPPFDIEGAIRRAACGGGEYATVSAGEACAASEGIIRAQVVLIREDGHGPTRVWQGETAMGERSLVANKV